MTALAPLGRMFAVAAAVCFAVALILDLARPADNVVAWALGGLLALALSRVL